MNPIPDDVLDALVTGQDHESGERSGDPDWDRIPALAAANRVSRRQPERNSRTDATT